MRNNINFQNVIFDVVLFSVVVRSEVLKTHNNWHFVKKKNICIQKKKSRKIIINFNHKSSVWLYFKRRLVEMSTFEILKCIMVFIQMVCHFTIAFNCRRIVWLNAALDFKYIYIYSTYEHTRIYYNTCEICIKEKQFMISLPGT